MNASPSPRLPAVRVLRVVALVGLAFAVTLIAGLALASAVPNGVDAVRNFLKLGDHDLPPNVRPLIFALVVFLLPVVLMVLGRRLSWRALAVGYAAVTPVLLYLAVDDATLRRPQTMEEFSPAFPGAEASYAVLMRYGKQHLAGRDFGDNKLQMQWPGQNAGKPEVWKKFLVEHRAALEADWTALAPVRAWWTELNAFDRLADLTPPRVDAELIAFQPCRALAQRTCAIASLQALDGRGDDAIDTILPLLQVARKLQPSSRTLVLQMIAIVIERMAVQTAGFVLDHATVSPGARARLAVALAASGGGEAGARRLMAFEYVFALNALRDRPLGDVVASMDKVPPVRLALNVLSPFLYNPRATFNLYADFTTEKEEIVGHRQLDQLELMEKKFFHEEARPRFKNFMGALVVNLMVPAYSKVAAAYWKAQDERAALLARVAAP